MSAAPADGLARRVEEFVFREVALLDRSELETWSELFADDGLYWVAGGPDLPDPSVDVSIIYDNRRRLASRIQWLTSKRAFAQQPHSATVRQVSNLVVQRVDHELVEAEVVVVIWEKRPNTAAQQVATRTRYQLRHTDEPAGTDIEASPTGFRIVRKHVLLLNHRQHWENLTFLP